MDNYVLLGDETVKLGPIESFSIDETNVDGELCGAGRELQFYASLSADLKALVATKRLELEAFDAELSIQIRTNPSEKITEAFVKEKVKADKRHNELSMEVIKSERDYNKVENLFRTHQKRTDCIIALAYKQRTEISKNY